METILGMALNEWIVECLHARLIAFEESAAASGQPARRDAAMFAFGVTCGFSMAANSIGSGKLLVGDGIDDCLRRCYGIAVEAADRSAAEDVDGGAE